MDLADLEDPRVQSDLIAAHARPNQPTKPPGYGAIKGGLRGGREGATAFAESLSRALAPAFLAGVPLDSPPRDRYSLLGTMHKVSRRRRRGER